MARLRIIVAGLALGAGGILMPAQQVVSVPDPPTAKPVPQWIVPTPFPPDAGPLEIARSIQLRSADAMSEQDRLIEADAESSIAERAGYNDIAFNQGKWSYDQLVCPALPNHLFLRFTRNNGAGDVSLFSASIPRNGEGHVRIIPIERRSYSLFSPAPINALTISAFNRIRAEEKSSGATPGWLGTALCYAALAGANPVAARMDTMDGSRKYPQASPPILEVTLQGGAVIRFTDMSAKPRPMVWSLIFNSNGRLLKATHGPAGILPERAVLPSTAEQTARPIPPFQ
ncbi:MAG TPA: hypothetical protein VHX20_09230 [Terracidiphilus sp.]|jgi:hypothetical protein|nr:hypothetical protein [Terracidiphilus sp.]